MKPYKSLLAILCLMYCSTGVYAQLTKIELDSCWRFILTPNAGEAPAAVPDFNEESSSVTIPHTWNVDRRYAEVKGVGWYQRMINIPLSWKEGRVRLCFEAVYRDASIYINKQLVGQHLGSGYTRFYVDITPFISFGKEHELIVSASNKESLTALPFKFDWNNDGGIIRPVYLEMNRRPSIEQLKITPKFSLADSLGHLVAEINMKEKMRRVLMEIEVADFATKKTIIKQKKWCNTSGSKLCQTINLGKIKPWHFDAPHLYSVSVRFFNKEGVSDERATRIGFRKIEIKGERFYLNGEAIRVPGIEYMAGSTPAYGMAEPIEAIRKAVDLMKESNSIITRFHWQQDERLLDLLDEKGMLVQEEIPWWQAPGNLSPEMYATAQQQIDEMVTRDYHHPCIFSWGVGNEIYENSDQTFPRLINHTRSLDSTRMVAVVSNELFKRLDKDESLLADIPTWNEYIGTWHGKSRYELPMRLDSIYRKALNKGARPLLITENGLCEPAFLGGDQRRMEEMVYHYDQWAQREFIFGAIYFSLNDYRTYIGESGEGIYKARIHGLTTLNFRKKVSFDLYTLLASPLVINAVEPTHSGEEADVWISVKKALPTYAISGYYIRWRDGQQQEHRYNLPTLQPGEDYRVRLSKMDPADARIEIVRPTGYVVCRN